MELIQYLNKYNIPYEVDEDNLLIDWALNLEGTQVTSLPNNLIVATDLYLADTQITSLPANLSVGGSLYLGGSDIPIWQKENIGSRGDTLYGVMWGSKPALVTGCFFDTVEKFLEKVEEVHGDNKYGKAYKEAVAEFMEVVEAEGKP